MRTVTDTDREIQAGRYLADLQARESGVYKNPVLQKYVQALGKRLAATSPRPNLPWTFRVLTGKHGGYSLPGGFVSVEHQFLTVLDSEAELAAVICHEIGHVVSRDVWSKVGTLVSVSNGKVDLQRLRQPEGKLIFEKLDVHGTANEKAADAYAFRCLVKNGYPPRALLQLLQTIIRESKQMDKALLVTKKWRIHMQERVTQVKELLKVRHDPSGSLKRTEYLRRIVGLVVGRDPRTGIQVGQRLVHVRAGLELQIPSGWAFLPLGRNAMLSEVLSKAVDPVRMIRRRPSCSTPRLFSPVECHPRSRRLP